MVRDGRCLVITPQSHPFQATWAKADLIAAALQDFSRFGGSEACAGRGTLAQHSLLVKALLVLGHDL